MKQIHLKRKRKDLGKEENPPGNLITFTLPPLSKILSSNNFTCEVLPLRSRPSSTIKAPRAGGPLPVLVPSVGRFAMMEDGRMYALVVPLVVVDFGGGFGVGSGGCFDSGTGGGSSGLVPEICD